MAVALRAGLLALGLVLFAWADPCATVQAAELDKKARAEAKSATAFYKEGQYEEAAKIFVRLSVDYPDMLVFVRNLGACYYYLRRPEPALSNLRDYLHRKKNLEEDDKAEVERWITQMEKWRDRDLVQVDRPAPLAPAIPMVASPPALPVPAPVPAAAVLPMPPAQPEIPAATAGAHWASNLSAPPPETKPEGSGQALAWTFGILGAASVTAGGVFTVLTLNNNSALAKKYDPDKERRTNTYGVLQWVGYGVGGASIITAILLASKVGKEPKIAFLPTVNPQGVSGTLAARF